MRLFRRKKTTGPVGEDETLAISRCIRPGDTVIDVGANTGEWSRFALERHKDLDLHLFEASPVTFKALQSQFVNDATLVNAAVGSYCGKRDFFEYKSSNLHNSLYRRHSVEGGAVSREFETTTVDLVTLDSFWSDKGNALIHFLKIDVEGAEYDVLRGCSRLLRKGQINYIQFEYGGTYKDAGITLELVHAHLRRFGYRLFKMRPKGFEEIKTFKKSDETYGFLNVLAVNERLYSLFTGDNKGITVMFSALADYGVKPRGVVHVGAHEGKEHESYRKLGIRDVVFIEANPGLAEGLRKKFARHDSVAVIEKAASDRKGVAEFNITSMDQSSSLLPLKKHLELYPNITKTRTVSVETDTLDAILSDNGLAYGDYNLLSMDIQGAELMALRGAEKLLAHVEAIQLEINYAELYEGAPLIWDIDAFLEERGFLRVATATPYHESWGDALYVRKPRIYNNEIGRNGRFGNQIFQYMFAKCWAMEHGYDSENIVWIGDHLFDIENGSDLSYLLVPKATQTAYGLLDCPIANGASARPNSAFSGYFQYHTKFYRPYQSFIRDELRPSAKALEALSPLKASMDRTEGLKVGIHLRRGDYGYDKYFIAPETWYLAWLKQLSSDHANITVYLASDDLDRVLPAFADYTVVSARDFDTGIRGAPYFADFFMLTQCDMLAISNSSFSYAAAMLSDSGSLFMRPDLSAQALIEFDPWDSEPLLSERKAEEFGGVHVNDKARRRSRLSLRGLLRGRR